MDASEIQSIIKVYQVRMNCKKKSMMCIYYSNSTYHSNLMDQIN